MCPVPTLLALCCLCICDDYANGNLPSICYNSPRHTYLLTPFTLFLNELSVFLSWDLYEGMYWLAVSQFKLCWWPCFIPYYCQPYFTVILLSVLQFVTIITHIRFFFHCPTPCPCWFLLTILLLDLKGFSARNFPKILTQFYFNSFSQLIKSILFFFAFYLFACLFIPRFSLTTN